MIRIELGWALRGGLGPMKKCSVLAALIAAAAAVLLIAGCKDDPTTPQTGTLTINPEPNSIDAPWHLSGPAGFASSGQGDMVLANMDAGNYTVSWGTVSGWDKPNPAELMQTLAGNGTLTFIGTYLASEGSITVDAEPNIIDAPWQLVGPNGFSQSGAGDAVVGGLSAGGYTLSWGAADSYGLPDPATATLTLSANGDETIVGVYTPITGSLVVDPQPVETNAPWQVSGPYGFMQDGTGRQTLEDVLVGTYAVSWGAVSDYDAPADTTATVLANQTVTATGHYWYLGLPFPDTADRLMANFRTIYDDMDYDDYRKLIVSEYITILQPSTTTQFPDVGPTLDLAEELRIHERMFSKRDVTDPEGSLVPGIQTIQFQSFSRQSLWLVSPASDPIPNAEYALYNVVILFDRGQTYSTMKVQGQIKFFVTHRDSLVAGVHRPYYQMRGQMDLTQDMAVSAANPKSTESIAWGTVKALFR